MQLYSFDGVVLPDGRSTFSNPAGPALDGQMALLSGGVLDGFGDVSVQPRLPLRVTLAAKAKASESQTLPELVEELRGLAGRRGPLIRREADGSNEQWATARLLGVGESHEVRHSTFQPLQFDFSLETGWEAVDGELAEASLAVGGSPAALVVDHSGSTREQRDLTISLTAGSAAITQFGIDYAAGNCSWRWKGDLAAGETLVIDCGSMTVLAENVDAYEGFSLTGNHRNEAWLALPANGTGSLYITWTDDGTGSTAAALSVAFRKAFW